MYQGFLGPGKLTLDVNPSIYSANYNAGFIRSYIENGGRIELVSPLEEGNVTGTYLSEILQILGTRETTP